jgi:hypothetical protein
MKTIWQKVYSFLGFWTYLHHTNEHVCHLVIYWCCLPFGKFFRKFDIIKIDVSKSQSLRNQAKQLLDKSEGEDKLWVQQRFAALLS